jgi:hypothetical protein
VTELQRIGDLGDAEELFPVQQFEDEVVLRLEVDVRLTVYFTDILRKALAQPL